MSILLILAAWAAPTAVSGTSVVLDPPEGFEVSTRFPGFTDGELGSIMVTELPVPRDEMAAELTAEAIASKGMKELSREVDDGVVLIQVEQTAGGQTVRKWMRIDGDADRTALIVGTVAAGDPRLEAVKTALKSVSLTAAPLEEHPATLAYAITPAKGFASAGRFSTMEMFTLGGKKPPIPDEEPRFMVGPSLSPVDLSDVDAFARLRLKQLPFENPRDIATAPIELQGRKGVELRAVGTNPMNRVDRSIYQLILPEPDGTYWIAVGIGTAKELKTFQEMARSIRIDLAN
jgi:hypothetical protein